MSTLFFAELVAQAGFPPGVVNVVTGSTGEPGAVLVGHPGIDTVAFAGPTATGRTVVKAAVENLSRLTLELGGKAPRVVFADADRAAAANGVVAGVSAASGQSCMAGSRLIVHDSVNDDLVKLMVDRISRITLGDPHDTTEMGPMSNASAGHEGSEVP